MHVVAKIMPRTKPVAKRASAARVPPRRPTPLDAPADCKAACGLKPWETVSFLTPDEHRALAGALPPPPPQDAAVFAMPWERGRPGVDEAKARMGGEVSADALYKAYVARTPEECAAERALAQRTDKWKEARALAFTGSGFGSAAGNNKHVTPRQFLKEKVRPTPTLTPNPNPRTLARTLARTLTLTHRANFNPRYTRPRTPSEATRSRSGATCTSRGPKKPFRASCAPSP